MLLYMDKAKFSFDLNKFYCNLDAIVFPTMAEIKWKSVSATTMSIKPFVRLRKNYNARVCFAR